MKVSEIHLADNSEHDWLDAYVYIQVGQSEYRLGTSLEVSTGIFCNSDTQFAETPTDSFDECPHEVPGVVQRTYEKLRPEIEAKLRAAIKPPKVVLRRWYALRGTGDMSYVGEHDNFFDADAAADSDYVWLFDETEWARWTDQVTRKAA